MGKLDCLSARCCADFAKDWPAIAIGARRQSELIPGQEALGISMSKATLERQFGCGNRHGTRFGKTHFSANFSSIPPVQDEERESKERYDYQ